MTKPRFSNRKKKVARCMALIGIILSTVAATGFITGSPVSFGTSITDALPLIGIVIVLVAAVLTFSYILLSDNVFKQ